MSLKVKSKVQTPVTGEQMVYQYFKCIDAKDLEGILELFDYDAVVREPFSNVSAGLRGKSSIEPFLKVALMANTSLHRTIKIEKQAKPNPNKVTAMITFEKGDKVKGKFTFQFSDEPDGSKKIKSLDIEFL